MTAINVGTVPCRISTFTIESNSKIDSTPSSLTTQEKVAKYAFYFFTFGIGFILYNIPKLAKKVFYAIFPGDEIAESFNKDTALVASIGKYRTIGLNTLRAVGITTVKDNETNQIKKDVDKQFIPLVVKGLFRDHITFLGIDKKGKTIIFYDPKGYTLKDYKDSKIAGYASVCVDDKKLLKTVGDVVDKLFKTFIQDEEGWKLEQNIERIQHDAYNCGVHFYKAVKSFEDKTANVFTNVLRTKDQTRQVRVEMINALQEISVDVSCDVSESDEF